MTAEHARIKPPAGTLSSYTTGKFIPKRLLSLPQFRLEYGDWSVDTDHSDRGPPPYHYA